MGSEKSDWNHPILYYVVDSSIELFPMIYVRESGPLPVDAALVTSINFLLSLSIAGGDDAPCKVGHEAVATSDTTTFQLLKAAVLPHPSNQQ